MTGASVGGGVCDSALGVSKSVKVCTLHVATPSVAIYGGRRKQYRVLLNDVLDGFITRTEFRVFCATLPDG